MLCQCCKLVVTLVNGLVGNSIATPAAADGVRSDSARFCFTNNSSNSTRDKIYHQCLSSERKQIKERMCVVVVVDFGIEQKDGRLFVVDPHVLWISMGFCFVL